jgi:hypothetical protein
MIIYLLGVVCLCRQPLCRCAAAGSLFSAIAWSVICYVLFDCVGGWFTRSCLLCIRVRICSLKPPRAAAPAAAAAVAAIAAAETVRELSAASLNLGGLLNPTSITYAAAAAIAAAALAAAETVRELKRRKPSILVECLTPDLSGDLEAVRMLAPATADADANSDADIIVTAEQVQGLKRRKPSISVVF